MRNITYILWSELTDIRANEDDLIANLSSFDKFFTVTFLTNLNNFLALFPPTLGDGAEFVHIQQMLMASFLSGDLIQKYEERFAKRGNSLSVRPLFHRQQLLYLTKLVLLHAKDAGKTGMLDNKEQRIRIGDACLMTSDLLDIHAQRGLEEINVGIAQEHNEVINTLFSQMVSVAELLNPPRLDRAIPRVIDYLGISEKTLSDFYNDQTLSETFETLNGISLKKFLQMVWGTCASYSSNDLGEFVEDPSKFNLGKKEWASKLDFSNKELDSFYRLTTIDFGQLEKVVKGETKDNRVMPQFDFTTFRKYPFLNLSEDIFTCIDVSFLIEKASLGIFHTILNSLIENLPDNKKIRFDFFSHWGKVFESYVNEFFIELYPKSSHLFHSNPEFDSKTEMEAFDGLIDNLDTIIVMEYKGGSMKIDAKYSGDPETLLNELDKKYGRKGKGLSQIAANLEKLFDANKSKRKQLKGLDLDRVRRIFPILIVNELSLEFGFANWKLSEWFDEEIKSKQIDSSVNIAPLLTISVQHLETLFPYLSEGDFSLQDFASYYSDFRAIEQDWRKVDLTKMDEYHPQVSVNVILSRFRQSKGISFRDNEMLNQKFAQFNDDLLDRFLS